MLNYLLRIYTSNDLLLQDQINCHDIEESENQFMKKSFISRAREVMNKYQIDFSAVITERNNSEPTWKAKLQYCDDLSNIKKNELTPQQIRSTYYNHLESSQHNYIMFTDGSKMDNNAGYAMIHGEYVKSEKLITPTSIFSAELYAIEAALDRGISLRLPTVTVASDSKSSLQALMNTLPKHEIVKSIRKKSREFEHDIKLCWTPSHVGITGNELADEEAKKTLTLEAISDKRLPKSDYKILVKQAVRDKWKEEWRSLSRNKYRELTETPKPLPGASSKNRLWERTVTRLRLGHSQLTHGFLMNQGNEPPICESCDVPLTIKHVLTECHLFRNQRRICFNSETTNLKALLSKHYDNNRNFLYQYLCITGLLYKI